MHHVEDSLDRTAMDYLRHRFFQGQDRELQKLEILKLTPEEEALSKKRGEVCKVESRAKRGREMVSVSVSVSVSASVSVEQPAARAHL